MRSRLILSACVLFISALPAFAQYYSLREVVRTGDPVPNGTGTFVSIPPNPCGIVGSVMFPGKGSAGENGLYAGSWLSAPQKVVDHTHAIPGGQGNFSTFSAMGRTGTSVVFRASGPNGQSGVYTHVPPAPCNLVANLSSPIPGGQGNFTAFGGVGIDGANVVFHGFGTEEEGIYAHIPPQPCVVVANTATPIPGGGLGTFTAFVPPAPCVYQGLVAFGGMGSNGYAGFFVHDGQKITTIIDTNHSVPPGLVGKFSQFAEAALVPGSVAFHGFGTAGEEGVYIASIPPNPCIVVAQKGDQFPGGPVITGFGGVAYNGTDVAFIGLGSTTLYATFGGSPRAVISVGDLLAGSQVVDISIGPDAVGFNDVACRVTLTDGSTRIYAAVFNPTGTGIGDTPIATALTLSNHPNPFAQTTEIAISLPTAGEARLEVYDVAGRRVHARDLGLRAAGPHRVPFDGSAMPSGVYFCRVEAAGRLATHKLLIER